jgi:hypothetical protein
MYVRKEPGVSPERRVIAWIRKRIHPYCWGTSDRFKKGFQQTSKVQILNFYGCLRFDIPKTFLPKASNSDFMRHVTGQHILYGQSDGRRIVDEILALIDIDCHATGSFDGAVKCVEWLKANGFPNLFWCRSTNRRGIHAYLVVRKRQLIDVELDRALVNLERWLQYQHSVHGWDIEMIEIKGRPPIFEWGAEKYQLLNVKLGSLAKLPVEALDRPDELMATTSLSAARLNRLGLDVPKDWTNREMCASTDSLRTSNDDFGQIDLEELRQWQPQTGSRVWCPWIEKMAKIGLVEEDSMGSVVFELAKWLVWVELFDREDRQELAVELLQSYVLNKNNGHVSRLHDGRESEVLAQVERIVASAGVINQDSSDLFARIREGRENGKYRRQIMLAPDLSGTNTIGETEDRQYTCSTCMFINKETSLPGTLEAHIDQIARDNRMRKRNGEYPFVRFARRLLHTLWQQGGTARLNNELLTEMVGTSNPNQQVSYRRLLQDGDLIVEGNGETDYLWHTWELLQGSFPDNLNNETVHRSKSGYQPRAFSKSYSLSQRASEAFEDHQHEAGNLNVDETTSPLQVGGLVAAH